MNYTISEDEYYALDSVRGQLNLVSGLLTAKDSDPAQYNASDLCAFLTAQTGSMKSVLQSVDERYKVEREKDTQMSLFDWLNVIRYMSGAVLPHAGQLKSITDKMRKSAEVNPDMVPVLNAWIGAQANYKSVQFRPAPVRDAYRAPKSTKNVLDVKA